MRTGDNIRIRNDGRYEARYYKGRNQDGKIIYGYCYGATREEVEKKRKEMISVYNTPKALNLLILGAGVHGTDVYEIAKSFRIFNKISFLDDNGSIENVLGPCTDLKKYRNDYSTAIPAIGDSNIRKKWIEDLTLAGFTIPMLIHNSANVSLTCSIGCGTVICAGATVGANAKIGKGCIIDAGAIVERNAIVPDYSLVKSGEVYKSN